MMRMKVCLRSLLLGLALMGSVSGMARVQFDQWFENRTLRMDYVLSGDSVEQRISLDELYSLPYWAGRRNNLDSLHLEGNGQILMHDAASGQLIYCLSFSTLFQEWQHTEEAQRSYKSFECTHLLPFPRKKVNVTVRLQNSRREVTCERSFPIDPEDIQIRRLDKVPAQPHKYIVKSGTAEKCIDIAILAEGYQESEMDSFYADAQKMSDHLFAHEPFKSMKRCFNVVAVASPSIDTGVSTPRNKDWRRTALGAQFDTFYSDRYLTTLRMKRVQDMLSGIPYEHIVILVNTDTYGGGGIYNQYMIAAMHHPSSLPVCVHEFGHSFAGLADEYAYGDEVTPYYHRDVEPWEKNITTLVHFEQKWKDMVPAGTPIPTPENKNVKTETERIGVFEGAGYLKKGVYRPVQDCRMRVNNVPAFCPVCQRALKDLVNYYVK